MLQTNKLTGKFIVLDGPDGCGKTTQVKLLVDWLAKQGVEVVSFREPGATAIGEKIRRILLNPEHIAMTTAAEVMLYMAARVQLWNEKITPALKQNKCVVVDRWLSSTCAYQGYAGGFGIDKVIKIATDCLEKPWPDVTIILDIDLETAAKRLKSDLDRMEQKGADYHQKVREGFLELALRNPFGISRTKSRKSPGFLGAKQQKDFFVVNAADNIDAVHKRVIDIIGNLKAG